MSIENRPRLLVDGDLRELLGGCVSEAQKTFRERWGTDTNPRIVQMVLQGKPIDHWYYRSDQWISQPFVAPDIFMQSYVGPTDTLEAIKYGERSYLYGDEEKLLTEMLIEELSSK